MKVKVHETSRGIELYEILEDVFSLTPSINTGKNGKPLVPVHAYFEFDSYWCCKKGNRDFYGQQVEGIREDYLRGVDDLVREHEGPVITIESKARLPSTADHIAKNLGRKENTYFIQTGKYSDTQAAPVNIEPKNAAEFITRFNRMPIMMIGGALDKNALKVLRGEGKWEHYFKIEFEEDARYLSHGTFGKNAGCLTQWVYWLSGYPGIGTEIEVFEDLTFPLLLKENNDSTFL